MDSVVAVTAKGLITRNIVEFDGVELDKDDEFIAVGLADDKKNEYVLILTALEKAICFPLSEVRCGTKENPMKRGIRAIILDDDDFVNEAIIGFKIKKRGGKGEENRTLSAEEVKIDYLIQKKWSKQWLNQ